MVYYDIQARTVFLLYEQGILFTLGRGVISGAVCLLALGFLLLCQCSPAQRAPWWRSCDVLRSSCILCRLQAGDFTSAPVESVFRVWGVCPPVCAYVLDCGLGLVHKTQLTVWGLEGPVLLERRDFILVEA